MLWVCRMCRFWGKKEKKEFSPFCGKRLIKLFEGARIASAIQRHLNRVNYAIFLATLDYRAVCCGCTMKTIKTITVVNLFCKVGVYINI